MENNMFAINNRKNEDTKINEFFTIYGKHKSLDKDNNPITDCDNGDVLAKRITINSKSKYYIKVGAYGKIYNPMGLYSEGTSNKFLAKAGKNAWEFTEVNSKVFDMYINFLRTKNQAWLSNAEREMN